MGAMTFPPSFMQSFSQAGHMSSGSSTAAFPTSHLGSPNIRMPHAPQFQVPAGVPRSPVTPGPPGLGPVIPSSSNMTATASPGGPSLSLRPNGPPVPVLANPPVQQQIYSPYLSASPMAPTQGPWLQPSPVTTMLRPPFPSHPAGFAVPFPLSATGAPRSSATLPDTRPPGVASVATPPGVPTTATQSIPALGLQPELPPGVGMLNLFFNDILSIYPFFISQHMAFPFLFSPFQTALSMQMMLTLKKELQPVNNWRPGLLTGLKQEPYTTIIL